MKGVDITINASFLPHTDPEALASDRDVPGFGVRDAAFRNPAGNLIRIQQKEKTNG